MRERLYRSKKDKMVAGVCGGLADYFDVDPVIIRIVFVAATMLSGGMGLVVYILLWLIVPYKEEVVTASAASSGSASYNASASGETSTGESTASAAAETPSQVNRERKSRSPLLGYVLVALGLLFFADRFIPYFEFHDFWPLILVALGIGLLLRSSKK